MGVLAAFDATAAQDALAGVAHDGRRDIVVGRRGLLALEHALARTDDTRDVLQLALAALAALLAVDVVVGEQQLHACAAGGDGLGRVDEDLHALGDLVDAGCREAARAGCLDKADAAGTRVALAVVERAQRWDLVAALACRLEDGEAFFDLIGPAFDLDVDQAHVRTSLMPCRLHRSGMRSRRCRT